MISLGYIILGLILYLASFVLSKDRFHPLGISVFLWFICAGISCYPGFFNPQMQSQWGILMHCVVVTGGLSLYFPMLLMPATKSFNKCKINYTVLYKRIFNIVFALAFISFLIRFRNVLLYPPLLFSHTSDAKSSVPAAIPFLNYIELLLPYLSIAAFMEIIYSKIISVKRRNFLFFVLFFIVIIYSLLYSVSRGDVLVFILGATYIILNRFDIKLYKVIVCVFLIFIALIAFTFLRINTGSAVMNHFGNGIGALFSPVYTYIAMNFENLNKLVISNSEYTYYWDSLRVILRPFYRSDYQSKMLGLHEYNTLFFNARTYLYAFYQDLGFVGVMFYSLIIGFTVQLFYCFQQRDSRWILMMAFLQKALIFTFFGNYFFGETVLFAPYIFSYVLISALSYQAVKYK